VVSAKGEPLKGRQFLTESVKTLVLGVNFGTADRANMVRELINLCGNMAGKDCSVDQARVDGFDDAWNKDDVNLRRYTGNNMRDAVEYARVYFEGYDMCNDVNLRDVEGQDYSHSNVDDFPWNTEGEREAIHKVLTAPLPGSLPAFTSRHGYATGYSDGVDDACADIRLGRAVNVIAAAQGGKSYRKGYITGYLYTYDN
jgi:hypothetical protein